MPLFLSPLLFSPLFLSPLYPLPFISVSLCLNLCVIAFCKSMSYGVKSMPLSLVLGQMWLYVVKSSHKPYSFFMLCWHMSGRSIGLTP